tara:strand:+ start:959 stop:1825 length:867 start_codon:yes stop_codon:yes gene_type:complete
MTNTQEVDASPVADEPALKEAETKTEEVETEETATEETESEDSTEVVSEEPEITVEEKLAKLEQETADKQKAIDRKTAAYSSLQKAHVKQMQELRDAQAMLQAQEPKQEPSIEDFDNFEAYDKARVDFITEQAEKTAQEKILKLQQKAEMRAASQSRAKLAQEQEAAYLQVNPSYNASKVEFESFIGTAQVRPEVERAIVNQAFKDNVPQIVDFFGANNGANLGKLQDIVSMTPEEAAVEIYKIQQELKAPEKKQTKPVAKPLNKPKGGGKPKKDLHKGDVLENLGLK